MCRDQAGIGGGSTLEFSDVEVFQRIMDVNYMGSVRVAKAFLAMLVRLVATVVLHCAVPC